MSPSPSAFIQGIETDIIAIRQIDSLTITQPPAQDLRAIKQTDSLGVVTSENEISGNTSKEEDIIIIKQEDSLTVTQVPSINIMVVD